MIDARPLVLITRPDPDGARFADLLAAAAPDSFDPLLCPLVSIEPTGAAFPTTGTNIVFTSSRAVDIAASTIWPEGTTAWCVGDKTAERAAAFGMLVHSAGGDVEALIEMILQERPVGGLHHLRGALSRGNVAQRLTDAGLNCGESVVYEQIERQADAKSKARILSAKRVISPIFSPNTANILVRQGLVGPQSEVIAISAAVAAPMEKVACLALHIAARPDVAAMVAATVACLTRNPRPRGSGH